MIEARYDRAGLSLSVRGHALSAPRGEDLVCAGASTLAFTLMAALEDGRERFFPSTVIGADEIRVACRPAAAADAPRCRTVMDTVFAGFEMLAGEYPEHVRAEKEE